MKNFKIRAIKICILFLLGTFIQCASSKQEGIRFPFGIKDAYFQELVPVAKGEGSGFTVYIEIDSLSDRSFEYVYFKGKKIKLEPQKNNALLLVGHYTRPLKKRDLVMSADPKEEFKNQIPEIEEKIPFELKDNECIISYTRKGESDFIKLDNLPKK